MIIPTINPNTKVNLKSQIANNLSSQTQAIGNAAPLIIGSNAPGQVDGSKSDRLN